MTVYIFSPAVAFAGQPVSGGVPLFSSAVPFAGQYPGGPFVGPVQFSSAGVDGATSQIVQGDDAVSIHFLYGCKTTISLHMDRDTDSRGIVQWLDNGKDGDSYNSTVTIDTEDGEGLENIVVSDSTDQLYFTTPITNGFYPFGIGFATNQSYPVVIDKPPTNKNVDLFRTVREYKLSYSFATPDIYNSITESTAIADRGCFYNHWQIGGVAFPFGEFKDSTNVDIKATKMIGWTSKTVDTTDIYGDVSIVKLSCGEEQARQILQFFTGVMRGTTQTLTSPAIYDIFGKRYTGLTSCQVKLATNKITIEHKNWDNVIIGFSIQMVGV